MVIGHSVFCEEVMLFDVGDIRAEILYRVNCDPAEILNLVLRSQAVFFEYWCDDFRIGCSVVNAVAYDEVSALVVIKNFFEDRIALFAAKYTRSDSSVVLKTCKGFIF